MPLVDAMYAPYKDKWRFWFGLRLTIFAVIFLLSASLRGIDTELILLIQIFLFAAFSFVQIKISPFKSFAINVLDLFFMLNFCLLATFVLYFDTNSQALFVVTHILISSAFIVTLGIFLFHIHLLLKTNNIYVILKKTMLCKKIGQAVSKYKSFRTNELDSVARATPSSVQSTDRIYKGYGSIDSPSTTEDYSKYREPLLSGSYLEQ